MKKYKFLRISKYKKLRYIANNYKKKLVDLSDIRINLKGKK